MDEELSMDDSNQLLDSASDFANHPGNRTLHTFSFALFIY